MLLRISLILAILAGIGTIVVTHLKTREHVQGIITVRDENIKGRADEKRRADTAERTLASTRQTLMTTSNTLVKTEEELNGTKQQLATVTENLRKTAAELVKANEARNAAQAELAKWDQLGVKPEQVRAIMADVKTKADAIAALEDEKKILNRRVSELDNRIKILVGDNYEVPLPAGTKGNVVAVDPKWNFVVLDIGADKNILEGGVLMVHRNSQLVGKVRINEVMQNRSIASMLPGWKLGDVEEGDQVLY
jgi:hypothetical protein